MSRDLWPHGGYICRCKTICWICIATHGDLWGPMGTYGYLWLLMDTRWLCLATSRPQNAHKANKDRDFQHKDGHTKNVD